MSHVCFKRLRQRRVLQLVLADLVQVLLRARVGRRRAQLLHRPLARRRARLRARQPLLVRALPARGALGRRGSPRRLPCLLRQHLHPAAAALEQGHDLVPHRLPVLPRLRRAGRWHRRPQLAPEVVLHVFEGDLHRLLAASGAHHRLLPSRDTPDGKVPAACPRQPGARRRQPLAEADRPANGGVRAARGPRHGHVLALLRLLGEKVAQPASHVHQLPRQARPVRPQQRLIVRPHGLLLPLVVHPVEQVGQFAMLHGRRAAMRARSRPRGDRVLLAAALLAAALLAAALLALGGGRHIRAVGWRRHRGRAPPLLVVKHVPVLLALVAVVFDLVHEPAVHVLLPPRDGGRPPQALLAQDLDVRSRLHDGVPRLLRRLVHPQPLPPLPLALPRRRKGVVRAALLHAGQHVRGAHRLDVHRLLRRRLGRAARCLALSALPLALVVCCSALDAAALVHARRLRCHLAAGRRPTANFAQTPCKAPSNARKRRLSNLGARPLSGRVPPLSDLLHSLFTYINSMVAVSMDTQQYLRRTRSSSRRERAQGVPACAPALPTLLPRSRALYGLRRHVRAPRCAASN